MKRKNWLPVIIIKGSLVMLIIFNMSLQHAFGQGIRKDFHEMTQGEKGAFINALWGVIRPNGTIDNDNIMFKIAEFHRDNPNATWGSGIHFANSTELNIFHSWHRYAVYEMEIALQAVDPTVTIPSWDYTVNSFEDDPMWGFSFLGQFDSVLSLGREFNAEFPLPTQSDINSRQAVNSWFIDQSTGYAPEIEASEVHANPHSWVGGVMSTMESPRDPVFWLHHAMIDKLWQEWEVKEGNEPSDFTRLPIGWEEHSEIEGKRLANLSDPNAINDSRSLGIFYADDQLAKLEQYSVHNDYNSVEKFIYQYRIEANNFEVPSNKKAEIISNSEVVLKSGFRVRNGGSLVVRVGSVGTLLAKRAKSPQKEKTAIENISQAEVVDKFSVRTYSNNLLDINYNLGDEERDFSVELISLNGRRQVLYQVSSQKGFFKQSFSLGKNKNGFHVLVFRAGKLVQKKKIIL